VDGVSVAVHTWGDAAATPVLLWHGVGDDAAYFGPLAEVLAGEFGFRVVAPDAPGFGRSQAPPHRAALHPAALARFALRLLSELGVERCPFVGHSWGAGIGCHAAADAAQRVSALALLDGGYTELEDWGNPEAVARATESDWIAIGRERRVRDPMMWARAVRAALEPPTAASVYPVLRSSRVPVLLLTADHSSRSDAGRAAARGLGRFRHALPEADVRTLKGVGHDLPGDAGAVVGRVVGDFLARYRDSA